MVKGFNLCHESVWRLHHPPMFGGRPLAVPLCGERDAVEVVSKLVSDIGCEPVPAGGPDRAPLLDATAALLIGLWVGGYDPRAMLPPIQQPPQGPRRAGLPAKRGNVTTSMNEWADRDGAYWAAHDLRYDEMLAPLTKHLLPAAAIQPGERVLDVGCGCGNTTRLAARAAADGPVLGVDLSEPMLERARQRAAEASLRNVRFDRADAAVTPFEPVDLVMSQFGVMFFDDPVAAFTNLRAAGGRLAFLCWQEVERNENRMVKRKALGAHTCRSLR